MNATSFDTQEIDLERGAENVARILQQNVANASIQEASQNRLPPMRVPRKKRSDAGLPKKPPADPDEITLKLTLAEARNAAISCGQFGCYGIAEHIQDQIIAQLQKRLDALQKQK